MSTIKTYQQNTDEVSAHLKAWQFCFLLFAIVLLYSLSITSASALPAESTKALQAMLSKLDNSKPGEESVFGASKIACNAKPNTPIYTASFCWRGANNYVTGLFKSVNQHFEFLPSIDIFGVRTQQLNTKNPLGFYFEMGKAQYKEREKNHWILNGGISHSLGQKTMLDMNFLTANKLIVGEWGLHRLVGPGEFDTKLFVGNHEIQGFSSTAIIRYQQFSAQMKRLSYSGWNEEYSDLEGEPIWLDVKPFKHLADQKLAESIQFRFDSTQGYWQFTASNEEKNFVPRRKVSLLYNLSKSTSTPKDLLISTGINRNNGKMTLLTKLQLKLR